MSQTCIVCGNNSRDNFGLMYYKFPTCPLRRDKWIQRLNLEKNSLKSTSRVCQQHFSKSQIVRVYLIKNAIPKDLRKLTAPPENIQVVGHVYMDMGIDEKLERAVIPIPAVRYKAIRSSRNLTGEVCLICAQIPDPLETNQPPLASGRLSSFLNPHLWSMFILKLLNFPNEECQNVFVKTFGVNPGDWFRLCGPCFKIVEQAFTLEQEVAKLQKHLQQVKLNATKKLEESLKLDKINALNKKTSGVFDITKYIRQVFKDIPSKPRMECSTIKTEDEGKGVIFEDSPNFLNETLISSCDDDVDTNINIAVKRETVEERLFTGIGSNGDDNVQILTNSTSTNYNHYAQKKTVKTKIAKKLKLTAIKRCRLPEFHEQKPSTIFRTEGNSSKTHRLLPNRITCSLCPAKFIQRRNLQLHLDIHTRFKDTSCPKCNFPCITPEKLKRHVTLKRCTFQGQGSSLTALSSESHENHEKCHICGRIYPGKIQIAKHYKAHRQNKSTTCTVCKLPCYNRRKLANHMKICNFGVASSSANSSQADEFKCDLCGYTTDYPYVYSKHRRIHEQAKFNCELCSFPSLSRAWLNIHMKEMHGIVVKTPRVRIPKPGVRNRNRRKMNRRGEDSTEPISCHLCPALFPSEYKVIRHVRNVHEKCYRCSDCDITFEHNFQLRNHLFEKHGIEKTMFVCDSCGMQFSTYSAIYVHKKKFHSNVSDKPKMGEEDTSAEDGNKALKYERKCPHCEVCCCNMKALKNHMRDGHPELYKHKCDLCPLTYIASGNLKIHIKNVHLKEEVECEKCKAKMKGNSMRDHLKLYCKFRPKVDKNVPNTVLDKVV